ncbi:MAG: hypothetical protein U0R77_00550 [Mycolicibacterium insubricum]
MESNTSGLSLVSGLVVNPLTHDLYAAVSDDSSSLKIISEGSAQTIVNLPDYAWRLAIDPGTNTAYVLLSRHRPNDTYGVLAIIDLKNQHRHRHRQGRCEATGCRHRHRHPHRLRCQRRQHCLGDQPPGMTNLPRDLPPNA